VWRQRWPQLRQGDRLPPACHVPRLNFSVVGFVLQCKEAAVDDRGDMTRPAHAKTAILAVASGGGHWDELMLLRAAFAGRHPVYATTNAQLSHRDGIGKVEILPDCNREETGNAIRCLLASIGLVWRLRPRVVVTTGALPGLFCLIAGRLLGARTIWIDSIANSDEPSLSGRIARPFASLWLTQWPHLANGSTMLHRGALL